MRRLQAALCACLILVLGACGKEDEGIPSACLSDGATVLAGLKAAPGEVLVDGVRLSECVSDTAESDSLQAVGGAYVDAAAKLADRAEQDPEGDAALQLGYLLGAIERSEEGSQGVGYELGRRLEGEASRVPEGSRALARGRRAGASGG